MRVEVLLSKEVIRWIEELRMNHIDVNLIIQEELDQTLPQIVEDIVKGIYEEVI